MWEEWKALPKNDFVAVKNKTKQNKTKLLKGLKREAVHVEAYISPDQTINQLSIQPVKRNLNGQGVCTSFKSIIQTSWYPLLS